MTLTLFKALLKTTSMALACLAIMMPSHAATVYKTIGKFGEVKYSQFPPQGNTKVEIIELRSDGRQMVAGEMNGHTGSTNQPLPPSTEDQRNAQIEQQQRHQKELEDAKRCQTLRNNLTNLNAGGRIYEPDGNGGRKYLDKREIELKRENVQQMIVQYCAG